MEVQITKEEKRLQKIQKLNELHGWKMNVPPNCLPTEDRAKLGGGLRCFGKVYLRDENGNKKIEEPKKRCGNPAVKGSFFCKKCGGGNSYALTNNKSTSGSLYRGAFNNQLGSLFDAFLNDPAVLDIIPELTALRLAYRKFIEDVATGKPKTPTNKLIRIIKSITEDEKLLNNDKFAFIKDICAKEMALSDPATIMLMKNVTETIGNTVEKIYKIQSKDDFLLTQDGLKILLRCIIDILKKNVNEEVLGKVKQELLEVSIRTKGDLRKYQEKTQPELNLPMAQEDTL